MGPTCTWCWLRTFCCHRRVKRSHRQKKNVESRVKITHSYSQKSIMIISAKPYDDESSLILLTTTIVSLTLQINSIFLKYNI